MRLWVYTDLYPDSDAVDPARKSPSLPPNMWRTSRVFASGATPVLALSPSPRSRRVSRRCVGEVTRATHRQRARCVCERALPRGLARTADERNALAIGNVPPSRGERELTHFERRTEGAGLRGSPRRDGSLGEGPTRSRCRPRLGRAWWSSRASPILMGAAPAALTAAQLA